MVHTFIVCSGNGWDFFLFFLMMEYIFLVFVFMEYRVCIGIYLVLNNLIHIVDVYKLNIVRLLGGA